jgi:hypothetical protein
MAIKSIHVPKYKLKKREIPVAAISEMLIVSPEDKFEEGRRGSERYLIPVREPTSSRLASK